MPARRVLCCEAVLLGMPPAAEHNQRIAMSYRKVMCVGTSHSGTFTAPKLPKHLVEATAISQSVTAAHPARNLRTLCLH